LSSTRFRRRTTFSSETANEDMFDQSLPLLKSDLFEQRGISILFSFRREG